MTRWPGRDTVRTFGLMAGSAASVAMVVVGCQTLTEGSASVDSSDASGYRTSVSSSLEKSSSRSAARESERQTSITAKAVHDACDELSITSVDAIDAVNVFVREYNVSGPDVDPKAKAAIDALNQSADRVSASISDPLSDDLKQALTAWVDSARKLADAIARKAGPDEFNQAVGQVNDVKTTALNLCDAAY